MEEQEKQLKPGVRTTEFWLTMPTVVGAMMTVVIENLKDDTSQGAKIAVLVASMVAAGLAAAGYSWSRGRAKGR